MARIVLSSAKCSGKGEFACGLCLCLLNFFGKNCEFKTRNCAVRGVKCNDYQPVSSEKSVLWKRSVSKWALHLQHHSRRTDNWKLSSGKWCECVTEDCFNDGSDETQRGICACPPPLGIERPTNQMGEGISKCVFDDGYNNDKCHSPSSRTTFISHGQICSGKGECVCRKWKCHDSDNQRQKRDEILPVSHPPASPFPSRSVFTSCLWRTIAKIWRFFLLSNFASRAFILTYRGYTSDSAWGEMVKGRVFVLTKSNWPSRLAFFQHLHKACWLNEKIIQVSSWSEKSVFDTEIVISFTLVYSNWCLLVLQKERTAKILFYKNRQHLNIMLG